MKLMRMLGPALAAAALSGPAAIAAQGGLLGFRSASSAAEQQREKDLDAALDPGELRVWL